MAHVTHHGPEAHEPSPSRSPVSADLSGEAAMAPATHHGAVAAHASPAAHNETQQHPIKLYLVVWGWLFVLSTLSYLVDYFHLQGYLRWSLILLFMMLKAGLIVAVFMHMAWERLALIYAILLPPAVVLVFLGIMVFESNYTLLTRTVFFGPG